MASPLDDHFPHIQVSPVPTPDATAGPSLIGPATLQRRDKALVEATVLAALTERGNVHLSTEWADGIPCEEVFAKPEHVHPISILADLADARRECERLREIDRAFVRQDIADALEGEHVYAIGHTFADTIRRIRQERDTLRAKTKDLEEWTVSLDKALVEARQDARAAKADIDKLTRQNRAMQDRADRAEKELERYRRASIQSCETLAIAANQIEQQRDAAFDLLRDWNLCLTADDRAAWESRLDALLASQPAAKPAPAPAWVPEIGEVCGTDNSMWPQVTIQFEYEHSPGRFAVVRTDGLEGAFELHQLRPLPEPEREPWLMPAGPTKGQRHAAVGDCIRQLQSRLESAERRIDEMAKDNEQLRATFNGTIQGFIDGMEGR